MIEIILAIFLAIAPGAIILTLTKMRYDIVEWLTLSLSLSLGFMIVVSALLQSIIRLDQLSVASSFLTGGLLVVLIGKARGISLKRSIPQVRRKHLLFIIPVVLSLYYWHSAFGIHSIDMGWHAFWAQRIVASGQLPSYSIIEPFDQSSRFVFGPHLSLALFALATDTPPGTIFWFPLAIYSAGTIAGLYSIANRITGSTYAGLVTSLLYSASYLPGGYIQRGNLPDVMGLSIAVTTMYLLVSGQSRAVRAGLGGFLYVLTFALHPYAALVISGVLVLYSTFLLLHHRRNISELVKNSFANKRSVKAALPFLAAAVSIFPNLGYINASAAGEIRRIDYSGYVPSLEQYASTLGVLTLGLGLAGATIVLLRAALNRLLPLFWLGTLLILANGPLLGLGFEPARFLWRMVEPFTLLGGIFLSTLAGSLHAEKPIAKLWPTFRASWLLRGITSATTVGVLYLALSPILYSPLAYSVAQPNYVSDRSVGQWLLNNPNLHGRVAVDVEYDNTATWIMYSSDYPLFLYRVNFAATVAPEPYRQVYRDLITLFDDPLSASSPSIIRRYSLQYVITSKPDKSLLYQTPFLTEAYSYGSTAVFSTNQLESYGIVTRSDGWLLPTASGSKVALLKHISITYYASSAVALQIPIFSHITDPPSPDTAFRVIIDNQDPIIIWVPQGTPTESHLDYAKFWPYLKSSFVGASYDLELQLGPGSHQVTIESASDNDFEVYANSLRLIGISFDTRGLHQ